MDRAPPRRVLFSDADDERVRAALAALADSASVRPVLLGASGLPGVESLDPAALPSRERLGQALAERRALPPRVAARILERPANLALALLADGAVDAAVIGVTSHTADLLIACEMMLGPAGGATLAAGLFVMEVPGYGGPQGERLVFADCAVHPNPTAEQLAAVAVAAADGARALLGVEPRVALLSFSTHGSATHPDVDKVARATDIARAARPELAIDGELQADAALDAAVAGHKLAAAGGVAGRANVLVFPDLDAANIGYKLVRTLAGAAAVGAFVRGYDRPVAKLSRGATAREIVATAALLAAPR